mgnify:CR=1 FL=1
MGGFLGRLRYMILPAITLGLTRGENYHLPESQMEIEPMFTGIAQVIGALLAIDSGVCDE